MSRAPNHDAPNPASATLHATCVAYSPSAGLLIKGASGLGKSTLALELMALGCQLVSDDQTIVTRCDETRSLTARAPATIKGKIEARGVGILAATPMEQCAITALVDLSQSEEQRLPPERFQDVNGVTISVFYNIEARHFAPALIQWLKGGRVA